MKLRRVTPGKIRVPEVRVTARMDEETKEQFEASVKAVGIDEPIKCFEVDGELWLSDGLHRLKEAIKNNTPLVDVYVRPGTMEDVICNNLMSGHLRGKHPIPEMVRSIEYLWKTSGYDSEKIAEKTGLTRDYVEKLQKLSELTPLIKEALAETDLGVGRALALTKVKDPIRQEMVFHLWEQYRWRTKDLEDFITQTEAIVRARVQEVAPTATAEPVLIRCTYCHQEYDIHQIANPAVCINCSSEIFLAIATREAEARKEAAAKDKEANPK